MTKTKHAIEVRDIKKSFFLPNYRNDSFKRAITQAFKKKDKGGHTFNALDGISFNVEKGDFFGILGRNGSGKSTLLKIISEIYQPTSGSVKHDGKVVSFIELGVGFKPDLTGRENVFLNGALLGFSKSEVEKMYDDIVEFAELEKFMDQRLKNYSSGMKVRLAFSVAIRAKADILILDEVLAVGDAAFQKKCTDYFETLKNDGKTVILVTHSMGNVRQFCNKAIVIEGGKIIYEGDAERAADKYLEIFEKEESEKTIKQRELEHRRVQEIEESIDRLNNNSVTIKDIALYQEGLRVDQILFGGRMQVELIFESNDDYDNLNLATHIMDADTGSSIIAATSKLVGGYRLNRGENKIIFDIQNRLSEGEYFINLAIEEKISKKQLIKKSGLCRFRVYGMDSEVYSQNTTVHPDISIKSNV